MNATQMVEIQGVRLEVRRIAGRPDPTPLAPIVFLHEGLGSVALWTQRGLDWPHLSQGNSQDASTEPGSAGPSGLTWIWTCGPVA